jgi:hypothetical protein
MLDMRIFGVVVFMAGLTYFVQAIVTDDAFRAIIAFLCFLAATMLILEPKALERKRECCK